jgi:uncharacterized protein YuzE
MMSKFNFAVATDTDNTTGEVLAVYFQIRKGRVHETREFAGGNAFADFDRQGQLLGVEFLGACNVSIIDRVAPKESLRLRRQAKQFMRKSGPPALVG